MLRIDEAREAGTLKLEGRVVGPWIDTLRLACERALARDARIVLDLAGVDFIDRDAQAFLTALRARGARLLHVSPFVAELLREES